MRDHDAALDQAIIEKQMNHWTLAVGPKFSRKERAADTVSFVVPPLPFQLRNRPTP
jgi:hypothetical protein